LTLALLVVTSARAQESKKGEAAPKSTQQSDMGFDFFGDSNKKSPLDEAREKDRVAKLERRVHLRRQLLKWHQALGFVTLGALAATDIVGTMKYYDKFASAGTDNSQILIDTHEYLSIASTVLFGTTGILALAAPNPYPKPVKLDTALIHKVSMALAATCFVAEIVIGPIAAISSGKLYERDLALSHLILGYGAFAFMGVGTLAYVF
jgi:hypothetical protein